MATRGLSLERARRQKWMTGLVAGGISLTAVAVGLTYWASVRHQAPPQRNLASPAADVNQQLSGYTLTHNDQNRPVFTIHAARTVAYQQNRSTTLEEVTVEVFSRKGGNSDILRTHQCEYNPQSGDFLSSGPVNIEIGAHSSDLPGTGLRGKHRVYLETSRVSYHQAKELAETEAPVSFHMGPLAGTARGMIYATRDGWVALKHDVAADLAQGTEKSPRPPVHLTASALRYDKDGGTVKLAGPVEVSQGLRRARAENADIVLDRHNHVSQVVLEGHAQAFDDNPLRSVELTASRVKGEFDAASGQLRHLTAEEGVSGKSKSKGSTSSLTAQQFDMDLAGKPPKPLQGVAKGDVHINLESQPVVDVQSPGASAKAMEKKALSAAEVQFRFQPATRGLKDAETVGPGTLLITSADPKTGDRVITAGKILMTFDARSQIEDLQGTAPTQVVFHPPATAAAGSPDQQSQADHLDASFETGAGTLREVKQNGHYQYHDGDRQASADNAQYDAQAQTMLLTGHPQVWDANTRIKSQRITIDMRANTSVGEGQVQATHLASPAPNAAPAATPALPTNVLADRMVARRQSQTVHYEGHVRAWQGTDVVASSSLDVYRTQKRVSSGSDVETSYLQPASSTGETGGGTGQTTAASRPVTVRADFLEYLDQGRRARYHGNVRLTTESTTLQSDRLDIYFSQGDSLEGSQVDHAEADGHVKVTQPGRLGNGDHGEYFAGAGKIVLTGGPPVLVDDKKGSTTGQRLTFFIHDDRLFVDGGDQSPSVSKHRVAP